MKNEISGRIVESAYEDEKTSALEFTLQRTIMFGTKLEFYVLTSARKELFSPSFQIYFTGFSSCKSSLTERY